MNVGYVVSIVVAAFFFFSFLLQFKSVGFRRQQPGVDLEPIPVVTLCVPQPYPLTSVKHAWLRK